MVSCAYCYKLLDGNRVSRCGRCKKRAYCSKACQALDWKKYSHKRWCCNSGEIDFDYAIRECEFKSRGLGVFALRDFKRGEKAMVERPLIVTLTGSSEVPATAKASVDALLPVGGSLLEKIALNGISCDDGDTRGSGLLVNMSKVNHDCIGNCMHNYIDHDKVVLLVCSRDISAGEELTYPYRLRRNRDQRRQMLLAVYGFECKCLACTAPLVDAKLTMIDQLENEMRELGAYGKAKTALALKKGEELIKLFDELHLNSQVYYRNYERMFQVAVTQRKTLNDAKRYARLACEHLITFNGENDPLVVRAKAIAEDPSVDPYYLMFEN